jgi:uncharacterized phage infection (PIP) family protein YhgE
MGLLAFGLSGLVLLLAATALVLGSLAAVDDAATGFERQRAELLGMLGPASDALDGAATSATNAGSSLTSSAAAADQAASLTRRLAASFEGLSALSGFEILGTRPFAGLGGQFTQVAADARTLSTDLDSTAAALRTNVADTAAVAADLGDLATQLEALEASLGEPDGGSLGSATAALNAARIVLIGLLAWLAVPAVISTWLGWRLTRRRA